MSLKVAAYCRVSTDSDDQLHSLASQQRFFKEYIRDHPDWTLVKIYADEGTSGTSTLRRQQFNQMIADAELGKIQRILTKEVSRFARNTVDTLEYTRRLSRQGISVLFINDGIDTSDSDAEFRLGIMAGVAQEESRKTSERVKWGQRRSMEQGVVFGNDTTFGFTTRNGKLFVKEEEAEIVRLIFHKFVNEGKGTHIIARELYEAGIAPPRSPTGKWSSATLLKLLRNEKYVGDLRQAKSLTTDYLTHKRVPNDAPEQQVYLADHHEAVVERTLWTQAQELLAARRPDETTRQRYSNRYWCSGKIHCGSCGARFVLRENQRPGKASYRAWACRNRAHYGNRKQLADGKAVGCNMRMLNEKALHACVRRVIELLNLNGERIIAELVEALQKTEDSALPQELQQLQSKIQEVQRKKERVMDSYFSREISKEEMQAMKARYDAALLRQQARLAELQDGERILREQSDNLEQMVRMIREELLSSENVYRETIEEILVYDDALLIRVKYLPSAFRVTFSSTGRGRTYRVTVDSCEVLSQ